MAAVSWDPFGLMFADHQVRSDREIVRAAVAHCGLTLEHAAEELRSDRTIVMAAVAEDGNALAYAAEELRSDREIVMAAVARGGFALKYAAEELRSDRQIVMTAVARRGRALLYAAEELQSDREIVMTAVAEHGCALLYAAKELQSDREIVMAAVAQNAFALKHAAEELRPDPEIAGIAMAQMLGSVPKRARPDNVTVAAVPDHGEALNLAVTGEDECQGEAKPNDGNGVERSADSTTMMTTVLPDAPRRVCGASSTTELLSTDSVRETCHRWRLAETEEKLGSGGFATVKRGSILGHSGHSETPVAIKKNKGEVEEMSKEDIEENACHEVRIMRALQMPGGVAHPNIVHMYGYTSEKTTFAMELCDRSLDDLLLRARGLTVTARGDLVHQVSIACAWVVDRGIVHRDIKPANVLLKRKGGANTGFSALEAKLADFGLAKFVVELGDSEGHVGTKGYWAPESILGAYNEKSDVFSFGISALETFLVNPRISDTVFSKLRAHLPELDAEGALESELLVHLTSTFGLAEEDEERRQLAALLAQLAAPLTQAVHQDPSDRPGFEALSRSWRRLLEHLRHKPLQCKD